MWWHTPKLAKLFIKSRDKGQYKVTYAKTRDIIHKLMTNAKMRQYSAKISAEDDINHWGDIDVMDTRFTQYGNGELTRVIL